MGSLFEVCPVLRLLAIRHQANDLKAVVGRAGILQAGGGGHVRLGVNYRNHTMGRGGCPPLKVLFRPIANLRRRNAASDPALPL